MRLILIALLLTLTKPAVAQSDSTSKFVYYNHLDLIRSMAKAESFTIDSCYLIRDTLKAERKIFYQHATENTLLKKQNDRLQSKSARFWGALITFVTIMLVTKSL